MMYNPAAYVVSSTDQRGLVVITATMLMSWMVIVCLIRLYMRLALNGPLGWDDLAAFVGGVSEAKLRVHVFPIHD